MPTLIATRPFRYLGRQLEAGDEFESNPGYARVWIAAKFAKAAPEAAAKPKPAKDPPKDPPAKDAPKANDPPPRHQHYQTRRLRADDD